MNVLNGDIECYEFIDEPRQIDCAIGFFYCYEVIIFRVFISKFHNQVVIALHLLLHVVETEVARHGDGTAHMEVEIEEILRTMSVELNAHVATPNFGCLYGLKVSVAKIERHGVIAFLQPFQVYFQ